jgi:tetratricopeptide (TPR) repeat protein
MNRINLLLLVFICFIYCQKQPPSESSGSRVSIEKTIVDSNVNQYQNLSLEVQLRKLLHEADSISPLSNVYQPADSVISLESEITKLSASLFMENDPEKIFNAITGLLFDKLKITFEKNENDLDAVFPSRIILSRRGTCLGISLLILQIGEKLDIPLHGVLVPGHFFVRFDDGKVKRNFEPLRHGENMPEQWYRQKWPTNDTVRYSLRNNTKNEVIGVVCYTVGNCMMAQGKNAEAITYFKKAKGKFPDFIEAVGNEAIAYDKMGDTEKAVAILGELVKMTPSLDQIHSRYAPLLLKTNRYSDAESEYIQALKDEPESTNLLYGYAMTLFQLKKCESASESISRVLDLKPDYEAANQLKMQILQQCGQ